MPFDSSQAIDLPANGKFVRTKIRIWKLRQGARDSPMTPFPILWQVSHLSLPIIRDRLANLLGVVHNKGNFEVSKAETRSLFY